MFEQFFPHFSTQGEEIPLERLLKARDQRAALQRQCLEQYGQTLLSLTLLAAGGVKKHALLDYVFEKSLNFVTAVFADLGIQPTTEFIRPLPTGHEALFVLPVEAVRLKQAMMTLEDSFPLARLWDLDVMAADGHLLSRSEFNVTPRPCLLCDDNAKVCARSRRHSIGEITAELQRRVREHYTAEQIAELAYQALLREARLTPKPGLVDRINTGAHRDMDLHTFEQSAVSLKPFFVRFVLQGMITAKYPSSQVLATLRPLGLAAEKAMLRATQGINTHKGSIFAFGLVCCAIGRIYATQPTITADRLVGQICTFVAQFSQGISDELRHYPSNVPLTAGVRLFRAFAFTGARGEAEAGFPLVQQALGFYQQHKETDEEHRLWLVLLYLMRHNQDTNVAHRGGLEGLAFVQTQAAALLAENQAYAAKAWLKNRLNQFDTACIEKNLSPGGSADLLALTIFFQSLSLRGN